MTVWHSQRGQVKLDDPQYDRDWQAKLKGYLTSGVTLWPDETGPNGSLVTSTESVASRGFNTQNNAKQARAVLGKLRKA